MAVIEGTEGTDYLIGTSEDDSINGGWSGDFIFGGDGADSINGGPGNDVMAGGEGTDDFVFGPSSGNDLVIDFDQDLVVIPRGVSVDHVDYNPLLDATTIYFDPDGRDTVSFLNATVDDLRFYYAI